MAPADNPRPVVLLRPAVGIFPYIEIARVDHWVKNVFVLPGIIVALAFEPDALAGVSAYRVLAGLLAVGLVASSNYVINEILDSRFDAQHPTKRMRAIPSGRVRLSAAYVEWILLGAAGIALGTICGVAFVVTMAVLWAMGVVYNIPPLRSKDVPYVDVMSEAINNPIRLLAGWFIVGPRAIAPASLVCSYWLIGCYFMAIKRFSEYRMFNSRDVAVAYRKSFAHYTEQRLLVSVMFYGSAAMLFLGAFIVRYKLELIWSFPLVALVMAVYLSLAFKLDSAVRRKPRRSSIARLVWSSAWSFVRWR
jgi:decaprenyl-phosphate phosphoribosyltransferase